MNRCSFLTGLLSLTFAGTTFAKESLIGQASDGKQASRQLKDYPALQAYIKALRKIPAGTFQMGSDAFASEKPAHTVTLSAFRMAATPVTVAIWKEYCKATGTPLPKEPSWGFIDDHPINYVSWNDIMGVDGKGGFCAWASELAGFKLMLPTEAQFEYASLGGKPRTEFPWGDTFDLGKVWCSDKGFADAMKTAPVNRSNNVFRNAYGLSDISGNVYQWCSDLFVAYGPDAQMDPNVLTSATAKLRCARGGCWNINDPVDFRCSDRSRFRPDLRVDFIGFRLVAG
jgi:formylglycine-generating enzyme required for sulfatase activity